MKNTIRNASEMVHPAPNIVHKIKSFSKKMQHLSSLKFMNTLGMSVSF